VILSGTRILTGEGRMVVITTGDKSVIGKIKAILKQED
jgi:magnesium-transporting ATPase (P-type)